MVIQSRRAENGRYIYTYETRTPQPRAVAHGAVHDDVADALVDLAVGADDYGEGLRGQFHLFGFLSWGSLRLGWVGGRLAWVYGRKE